MSYVPSPRATDLDGPPERPRSRPSWGDALSTLFWSDDDEPTIDAFVPSADDLDSPPHGERDPSPDPRA